MFVCGDGARDSACTVRSHVCGGGGLGLGRVPVQ